MNLLTVLHFDLKYHNLTKLYKYEFKFFAEQLMPHFMYCKKFSSFDFTDKNL